MDDNKPITMISVNETKLLRLLKSWHTSCVMTIKESKQYCSNCRTLDHNKKYCFEKMLEWIKE